MGKRNDVLWCGCDRIEHATLGEANAWLEKVLDGRSGDVQISIVVGGERCSFWRNKQKPFSVGTFGPQKRNEGEEKK